MNFKNIFNRNHPKISCTIQKALDYNALFYFFLINKTLNFAAIQLKCKTDYRK